MNYKCIKFILRSKTRDHLRWKRRDCQSFITVTVRLSSASFPVLRDFFQNQEDALESASVPYRVRHLRE